MRVLTHFALFILAALCLRATPALGVDYTVQFLSPSAATALRGNGGQVVGFVGGGISFHAALWTGLADPIDLHPAGFVRSDVRGTNGSVQVGGAALGDAIGQSRGAMWSGTA